MKLLYMKHFAAVLGPSEALVLAPDTLFAGLAVLPLAWMQGGEEASPPYLLILVVGSAVFAFILLVVKPTQNLLLNELRLRESRAAFRASAPPHKGIASLGLVTSPGVDDR